MQNMFLSRSELRILAVLHLNATLPAREVAKQIGMREQTVRHRLRSLKERKLISFRPLIDVYRLGFVQWGVFFSLSGGSTKSQVAVQRFLCEQDNVSFVGELGGEYHFEVTVCARGPSDVAGFLENLGAKFSAGTIHKSVATRLSLYDFRIKHLLGSEGTPKMLAWGEEPAHFVVDSTDHEILRSLALGDFESKLALSRTIGISHTAVDKRLLRLERNRIVVGYRYLVDMAALGFHSHLILLYARGMSVEFRNRLLRFCRDHPQVRFLVRNFGGWEYECGIEVRDPHDVSLFTRELSQEFSEELGTFRVLPIFGYPKVVNYPFVAAPLPESRGTNPEAKGIRPVR